MAAPGGAGVALGTVVVGEVVVGLVVVGVVVEPVRVIGSKLTRAFAGTPTTPSWAPGNWLPFTTVVPLPPPTPI